MSGFLSSLTEEQEAEYKETFALADKDRDGWVNREEVVTLLRSIGISTVPSEEEEAQFCDSRGCLSDECFLALMADRLHRATTQEAVDLVEAFGAFDKQSTGLVLETDLRQVLSALDEPSVTEADIAAMILDSCKIRRSENDAGEQQEPNWIDYVKFARLLQDRIDQG